MLADLLWPLIVAALILRLPDHFNAYKKKIGEPHYIPHSSMNNGSSFIITVTIKFCAVHNRVHPQTHKFVMYFITKEAPMGAPQ